MIRLRSEGPVAPSARYRLPTRSLRACHVTRPPVLSSALELVGGRWDLTGVSGASFPRISYEYRGPRVWFLEYGDACALPRSGPSYLRSPRTRSHYLRAQCPPSFFLLTRVFFPDGAGPGTFPSRGPPSRRNNQRFLASSRQGAQRRAGPWGRGDARERLVIARNERHNVKSSSRLRGRMVVPVLVEILHSVGAASGRPFLPVGGGAWIPCAGGLRTQIQTRDR